MANMDNLIPTLNSIDKSTHPDDASRHKLLAAARSLVTRLEQPWERVYYLSYTHPGILAAIKTARDLNLFAHLSPTEPKTYQQLADSTKSDPALLSRIIRVLVASNWIDEVSLDQYTANEHSQALSDPDGLVNGIDLFYDEGSETMTKLPAYFASHNYQNPTDYSRAPWKWINNLPEDAPITRWQWLETNNGGAHARHLDRFLSSLRGDQTPLHELYDFSSHLATYDPTTPFLVDVGGGKGRDISNVASCLSTTPHASAKLILQDRPEVLANAIILPKNITLLPHDFFKPNPSPSAKVYFAHSVLHDWPDKECREILMGIKSAMKAGYSRLILMERVLPARAKDVNATAAVMDLAMCNNFAAMERTEKQWKELIESVGLKFLGVKSNKNEPYDFVEAEL